MLDPPHSVVWNLELIFSLEVITGINHGSSGQQGQQNGRKSDLKIPVHAPHRLRRPQGQNTLLMFCTFTAIKRGIGYASKSALIQQLPIL